MKCQECELAELRRAHPLRWAAGRLIGRASQGIRLVPPPDPWIGGLVIAMMGGTAHAASHYERHRAAWEMTGDLRELARMIRQVESCDGS